MKNIFLLTGAVVVFVSLIFYSSCKKPAHPLYPTPSNYRIQSYTKTTVNTIGAAINSSYSFVYDANNRVSQIYFSSNDNSLITSGAQHTTSTFNYFSDTIIKVTTSVNVTDTLEIDTFVTNPAGQIAYAYMPSYQYTFQYFGKLLALETETYRGDSGTSIAADVMKFTSNNSDFLVRSWDGTLTAAWADTGRNSALNPPDVQFVPPFTVTWTSFATTTPAVTTHNNVPGFTDVLNGYNDGGPLEVSIIDGNGAINRDICIFPMDLATTQAYNIYPSLLNRVGDYLQLQSFTTYGTNIYQNTHLINNIENADDTTIVTYVIDADSKITQTNVITKYVHVTTLLNMVSEVYNIQYEAIP